MNICLVELPRVLFAIDFASQCVMSMSLALLAVIGGLAWVACRRWGRQKRKLASDERLLRKLLDLQEQERKLLSYEIHDGLVQYMVGAHMALESIRDDNDLNTAEARHQMNWSQDLITKAINEARHLISELRPMIIDEQGIVQAIHYLLEEHDSNPTEIRFTHALDEVRLPGLLEATLFRIVQESLNNIAQHSQARHASIAIRQTGQSIELLIEDDGIGFDKRTVPENRFGVEGIVRRAELFGGAAEIRTSPKQGTRINVRLPITPPHAEVRDTFDDSTWRSA